MSDLDCLLTPLIPLEGDPTIEVGGQMIHLNDLPDPFAEGDVNCPNGCGPMLAGWSDYECQSCGAWEPND